MKSRPIKEPKLCGDCTVCCTVLSVTGEGINKPFGKTCEKLGCNGCTIYDTKPEVCTGYYCMWTLFEELPDWAKPNKLGILITVNDVNSHFTKLTGLPTFSAYEVTPGAFDSYWAQKLFKKLSKHWTLILLRHGRNSVDGDTEFIGPKKEIGVINAYNNTRMQILSKERPTSNLSEEP